MAQGKCEMLRIKGAIELITYMVIQTHVYYCILLYLIPSLKKRPRRDPYIWTSISPSSSPKNRGFQPHISPYIPFNIFQPHGQSKTHGNNAGLIGQTYPFAGPQLLQASRLKDSALVIGIRNNAYSNDMCVYIYLIIYILCIIYNEWIWLTMII